MSAQSLNELLDRREKRIDEAEERARVAESERNRAVALTQMLVHWTEGAHERLRQLVPWESEVHGLSDLADDAAGFLASVWDGDEFKTLRIHNRWREEIDAVVAERDEARKVIDALRLEVTAQRNATENIRQQFDAEKRRADETEAASAAMRVRLEHLVGMSDESTGITGFHLNGAVMAWDEYEIDKDRAALTSNAGQSLLDAHAKAIAERDAEIKRLELRAASAIAALYAQCQEHENNCCADWCSQCRQGKAAREGIQP